MRMLPLQSCKAGMTLGKSVYLNGKSLLLREGSILNEAVLLKLARIGVQLLHIKECPREAGRAKGDSFKETMHVLEMLLSRLYDRIYRDRNAEGLDDLLANCRDAVGKLAVVLERGPQLLKPVVWTAMTSDSRRRHFIENALHVCVNAMTFGLRSGCLGGELQALGTGALLHNIGSLRQIADSNRHPQHGYTLLKQSGAAYLAAVSVLQHRERIDGSGYPLGLRRETIEPFARWIGLIDYFDVLVHGREGQMPMPRHQALELLYSQAGASFDFADVRLFCNCLELFAPGLNVRLSTGEYAVVTDADKHRLRPVVRVVRNSRGETLRRSYEIDLSQELHIMIELAGGGREPIVNREEELMELAITASC